MPARRTGFCFAVRENQTDSSPGKGANSFRVIGAANGKTIEPSPTAKPLGVVSDQPLEITRPAGDQTRTSTVLFGRAAASTCPEQMRQLYQACVTPVMDYASMVWHDPCDIAPTTFKHSPENSINPYPISFRDSGPPTTRSKSTYLPTHPPPPLSAEHHCKPFTLCRAIILFGIHYGEPRNVGTMGRTSFPLAEALKTINPESQRTRDDRPTTATAMASSGALHGDRDRSDRETARERAETVGPHPPSWSTAYPERAGHLGAAAVALTRA